MIDPTPEQIEAAAKALYCVVRGVEVRDFEAWPEYVSADTYRGQARDALVAAAGVAPCSELLCPLHHDGDSSPRNRADERTDSNLVDESPDRQTCNKSGNDGHDHFRSVHNAQGSNGADSPTPGVTPQEPTSERCSDCGDKLDYVAGLDGQGCYPHCWRCWYKDHPVEIPVQVDEAKIAAVLVEHREAVFEWGEGSGCICGARLRAATWRAPEETVEDHMASIIAGVLRGGGR